MIKRETAEDLANEDRVASIVAKLKACIEHKPDDLTYHTDRCFCRKHDDTLWFWGEVKCRKNASTDYPSFMIALHKIEAGLRHSLNTHTPFYLFVEFTDGLFAYRYQEADEEQFAYKWGGRPPREGSANDREVVVFIPMQLFVRIGT